MATNANAYNTRLTDEALEKRFRDAFRAQGGAELVDDLYASGVIVPVVDFTAAAEGSALRADLQLAYDFTQGNNTRRNNSVNLITTAGFWRISVRVTQTTTSGAFQEARISLSDGLTTKPIWKAELADAGGTGSQSITDDFIVFVRAGDTVSASTDNNNTVMNLSYRQVADVSGNLTNPSGFVSS